jgi:predicted heme/steroid binding protein
MSASSSPPGSDAPAGGESSARVLTLDELAEHDGRVAGRPILIGYKGRVYDVTHLFLWMTGQHFWLHAGRDLTGRISEAPHGEEMLQRARCVGVLA